MKPSLTVTLLIVALFAPVGTFSQPETELWGTWELLPALSHDIGHLRTVTIELRKTGSAVTLIQTWGRGRQWVRDSVTVVPGGPAVEVPITRWPFVTNVFMGLRLREGDRRRLHI